MAAELVNAATSEKLAETDWTKNIEICELVARDQRQARDVVKAIKKRLSSKNPNTQLYAVMLLEMLMNNIGEHIHKQVIDTGIIPILVKIVKKKSDLPVRERIFLLLDATQTSLGGASGKFPQYYNAYYDLVSAGVQLPQSAQVVQSNHPSSQPSKPSNVPNGEVSSRVEGNARQAESQAVPESSIIQKASNALEVLKEVLDAVDPQHPEGASDEFTLDLVEQCSFQKQRVMHLVMTSRDERIVSRAIELNEQLQKVLARHDDLISGKVTTTANRFDHEEAEEEEEAEQLFRRRLRKGKACARPEDEETASEFPPLGLIGERPNRPLIRPLSLERSREADTRSRSPPAVNPPPNANHVSREPARFAIPPPPAKHIERERFFQENKVDGSTLSGHMRGLSIHSRNGSSSHSGSFDSSD
ncbi:TOM1-like protein 5 [Senna tora]|uniref:TOM1-like protein 5 n=1 Tax=Senna tora TaxID=362788 RepID=A0A834WWI9_9FABA|nr:TOM1-like protein 5 [Senna tora]